MLISRAAASSSSSSAHSSDPHNKQIGERQHSLNNLWLTRQRGIRDAFEQKEFLQDFSCELLNSSETAWIKSSAAVNSDGTLQFFSVTKKSNNLGTISLQYSVIVGHISQSLIQISTDSKIVLLSVPQDKFEPICATLFSWSRLRLAGISEKLWTPPVPPVETETDLPLLRCGVMAFFTEYHPERTKWAPYEAYLMSSGELALRTADDQIIYTIRINTMRSSQIKMMDPSVVNSDKVIMLFPDFGGPDTVYLKFEEIVDYGDWVATLKALGQQEVAGPLSRDSLKCIRWNDSLIVKIGACEKLTGEKSLAYIADGIDLRNTYIEVCLRRWTFARTCINLDPNRADWCQTFELADPETSHMGPGLIELKLRRTNNGGSLQNTGEDITWVDFPETDCSLNINITYKRTPVLDSSFYSELQKFFDDITMRAASRMVHDYPSMISSLVPIFSRIYRAQGRQLEWILDLASEEIDSIDLESDVLFRGSSLFTRVVELLLQQDGKSILEKTVGRFIRKMKAIDKPIEMDPTKATDEAELKMSQITMDHYLRYLWPLIRNEGIPESAKKIFKHMAFQLRARGLEESDIDRVMNRTLAAFLFLRFYGPALVNPQKYYLTDQNLDSNHCRTLVLVAKALQGFANRVRFGSKETWLMPMNEFINDCEPDLLAWYAKVYKDPGPSGMIRHVSFPILLDELPPKELPVETFMGQQLTSPNLVDEYATYSQLATIVDAEVGSLAPKISDSLVDSIVRECRFIVDKQNSIIKRLEEPDTYEESCSSPAPSLYLNLEASLFGLRKAHLEFEPEIRKTSSFSESITKLARIPNAALDDVKSKPGSVRKLIGRFRITRAPSPSQ